MSSSPRHCLHREQPAQPCVATLTRGTMQGLFTPAAQRCRWRPRPSQYPFKWQGQDFLLDRGMP